ncbi:hypothetical protein [Salidesulfovibrio onnuriiensis]|uniref:hypothetical protein n=1 Tax=Salidesulfovibrio onnuriiensis TaxID=2583823 RepID=UPI0011CB1F2F|nr:hypothetical protein [Salidesulfovibrio onnuriiensis]
MNTMIRKICFCLVAFLGAAVLAGCAANTVVPLNYSLVASPGQACRGPMTVLKFKDAREQRSLGRDADGNLLRPATDVADWVGWSLYEELSALSCPVEYHGIRKDEGARTILSGEVVDVRLMPMGKTVWKAKVSVLLNVEREGKVIVARTFSAEREKPIIFGVSSREEVLTEALQGVMEQMVSMALTS